MKCPGSKFDEDGQWWFNFMYRTDKERGQCCTEDLWTPGFFKCRIDSPTKIVLWARLADHTERIANTVETEPCNADSVDRVRKDEAAVHATTASF